ncbi:cytochrome c550 [Thalassobacillus pellis]|uniref:cytochrome c550 n=1 Tax=Thalassobacillus pellis TaxID=748008 RepID=UPI001962122C|nr:cytochrome c [Thalassobacillus pellis]MBM7554742.1 cytochrome c550 [Thalassobacillus pellis]
MRRNPVIPFAIIAVLGILTMFVISWVGVDQHKAIENGGKGGGEEQAASTDPEAIFKNNCASCHGADLSGGTGPNLQKVGSRYSKEQIKEIIINGKGQAMPAGLIPAEEAAIVAEWLSKKK